MSRPNLIETFSRLRARSERALIPFVTAGDPSLEDLPLILEVLCEAGADAIEIGMPFSDPIADGPTIQASSQRALNRGVTPHGVLDALAVLSLPVPVVVMGYYNPVLRIGLERFAQRASQASVAGVIISDLTPEESAEWRREASRNSIETIFLAAPTSTDERLDSICAASSGFVYAVSRTGVTGLGHNLGSEVSDLVRRIRRHTELPLCVGFGIRSAEDVATVCQFADGAVVGSFLVDLLAREWNSGNGKDIVRTAIRELKSATQ